MWKCPACNAPLRDGERGIQSRSRWRVWFDCVCGRQVLVTKTGVYAYDPAMPTERDMTSVFDRTRDAEAARYAKIKVDRRGGGDD